MSTPWGYKLTFSAYFEAHRDRYLDEVHIQRLIAAVANEVPDAHFLGAQLDEVASEPNDQVAS